MATGLLINNETITPRFDWDTKISALVPEFNVTDPVTTQEARVIDLLSHRTGYPRHEFSYRYNDTIPDVVSIISLHLFVLTFNNGPQLEKMHYWRQSAEFRDVWQYNNNMYTLISALPSKLLNGKPFTRYVKENIFDRLGMNSTTYSYDIADATGNRADGMTRKDWDLYTDVFAGTPAAAKWWSGVTGGEDGNGKDNLLKHQLMFLLKTIPFSFGWSWWCDF